MHDTEEQALETMKQLGLPRVFMDIWEKNDPKRFCRQWRKPTAFFEQRKQLIERCPRIASCVPLLESNRDRIVAFEPSTGIYVEFYFEDLDVEEIGSSYQQFLTTLFVDLGYAGLMDLVEEVSSPFEYKHLDAWMAFMEVDDEATAEDAKRAFVGTIVD
ncbi:MAG: hypothetical protein ACI9G1_000236 [Pirellulaceae bacterium]|jgi:hypothetical protein